MDLSWQSNAKMGSIKDRNSMDLREAEDIKKRWQEYTEVSLIFFCRRSGTVTESGS